MSLREEIKTLSGNKRRFFLMRIADMDTKAALKLCNVVRGTYNSWLQNRDFVEIYRRRVEFNTEYKQEAIQLLRRDNQLEAVLLESKIIAKMKEEIEDGNYDLIRSNLAKEVYSKLMTELDAVPQVQVLTWQQKLELINNPPEQITEGGDIVDGSFTETNSVEKTEPQTSQLLPQDKQTHDEVEKEAQD